MTKPATEAYWWQAAPLTTTPQRAVEPSCDVAIIGAGYTGLSAAISLARAGRSVQLFDRQRPGEGASTRNGGITSGNLRLSDATLATRFGAPAAAAILEEGKAAREDLYRFIAAEGIDCDFELVGRFAGAYAPRDYDTLARAADTLHRTLGIEAYAVPRAEQRGFLGTDTYHGGNVRMDIGGIHPAKFHAGMLRVAQAIGAVGASVELTLLDRLSLVDDATIGAYARIGWQAEHVAADVLEWAASQSTTTPASHCDLVVANLFLHHFEGRELASVMRAIGACSDRVFACEPRRSRFALVAAHLTGLIGANAVTREDAVLSVRAGFDGDELTRAWTSVHPGWTVREYGAGPFSHCFDASRTGSA